MLISELRQKIYSIENMDCSKYSKLYGIYQETDFTMYIYNIKSGNTYTAYIAYQIPVSNFNFIDWDITDKKVIIPLADYLLRDLYVLISGYNTDKNGEEFAGGRGRIISYLPDQRILERNVIKFRENLLEFKIKVELPDKHEGYKYGNILNANKKKIQEVSKGNHTKPRHGLIDSKAASKLLCRDLPGVMNSLVQNLNYDDLSNHVKLYNDQEYIRDYLKNNNYCAFIGNGSILPRKGQTDFVEKRDHIKFQSPESLQIKIPLQGERFVEGMGIKEGVTLILGEGYHGKSTILNALEHGVYNHCMGDGREYVITDNSAIKICAEDGRNIQDVDLSAFINNLPNKADTRRFSTKTASGSTSQAAAVMEALQAKSKLLLFDEDRSANNFINKDICIQKIIDQETITPYIDRVVEIHKKQNTSSILVMGGSGDYINIADTILYLSNYHIKEITEAAKKVYNETYLQKRRLDVPYHCWHDDKRVMQYNANLRVEQGSGFSIRINTETMFLDEFLTKPTYGQVNLIIFMFKYLFNPLTKDWGDIVSSVEKMYAKIRNDGLDEIGYNNDGEVMELLRPIEVINLINHIQSVQIRKV